MWKDHPRCAVNFAVLHRNQFIDQSKIQVALALLAAFGARITNNSIILGCSTPTLQAHWGKNLAFYGKLREHTCQNLLERAKNIAVEVALADTAAYENIAVLALLEEIVNREMISETFH
jgi:hypothetical protein